MKSTHPSPERLELFMTGRLPREEGPQVLRHLASGCPSCSATTTEMWEVLITGRQAPKAEPHEYEEAFDRAWVRAQEVHAEIRRERESAGARCQELISLSPRQQQLRFRNDTRFQTLALCQALVESSRRTLFDDPAAAAHRASLALEIADLLREDLYGAAILADAKAEAWGAHANAARESSDFERAEEALRTARAFLDQGTGNPSTKAEFLSALANVLIEKGRIEEFLSISKQLEAVYSSLGDSHMLGRVQLKKAYALFKRQDAEAAIGLLQRALQLLDPARDPRRQLFALHNLTDALINAGRCDEAEDHVEELKRLHLEQGDRLNLLRFRWLEGRLALAKEDLDSAATIFSEIRNAFIELEIGFDVALVSLDLAEVLWRQGKTQETRDRLGEAIPILKALEVHAEALAAMAFLQHAVQAESLNRELIQQTVSFLKRLQGDPTLRFEAAASSTR